MELERNKYIEEQINIDYILKSKNTALTFMMLPILFIFLHKQDSEYKTSIIILAAAVFILSAYRMLNYSLYISKKLALNVAAMNITAAATANAFLWAAIGIQSSLSYDHVNIQILTTFIILIASSAASIVTLSHKRIPFLILNVVILFPIIFYSILEFKRTFDPVNLWLLAYTAINILYNIRQSKVIQSELKNNFRNEFDLKKSLIEVAQSKKDLEEETVKTFHASRLTLLGEMAGGMAHEINNPLTIIQGMTKSIINHGSSDMNQETINKLTKISSAAERIAKIVKSMKIISSKNDQIEHEKIRVSNVLELCFGLFEDRLKNESIQFTLSNDNDPLISCNPLQISQIIINLISNAMDAMSKEKLDNILVIKVNGDHQDKTVDIRVINNGPLLDHSVAEKMFEPFFTTKSLGKGTGLGLSISQTLAHSNGGFLSYEEYEGKTCFKLHLPIQDEA